VAPVPEYADVRPPRRGRATKAIVGWVVGLALLAGALWLVDAGVRDFAQTRAEAEIDDRLPDGVHSVDVTIGGFSVLQQLLVGSLDEVGLEISLDQAVLTALASDAGLAGDLRVSDSSVALDGQVEVLGVAIPYSITIEPSLDGKFLLLTATQVSAAGSATVDVSQFVDLSAVTARICAARLMPESIRLTDVVAAGDVLTISAVGVDVPTDLDALMARGSCDAPVAAAEEADAPAP
jgi:hypothetical protein